MEENYAKEKYVKLYENNISDTLKKRKKIRNTKITRKKISQII